MNYFKCLVMKWILLTTLAIFVASSSISQTISLDECKIAAIDAFPISNNLNIIRDRFNQEEKIISQNFLPELSLNANGMYQSDVVSFDLGTSIPGLSIPEIPHLQFRLTIRKGNR